MNGTKIRNQLFKLIPLFEIANPLLNLQNENKTGHTCNIAADSAFTCQMQVL